MRNLDRRLQDLERKLEPEGPVTFRLVQHGEWVDDGTPHIRLTWGDEPDQAQPEGADNAQL